MAEAWDVGEVFAAPQHLGTIDEMRSDGITPDEARKRGRNFVRDFETDPTVHFYRYVWQNSAKRA